MGTLALVGAHQRNTGCMTCHISMMSRQLLSMPLPRTTRRPPTIVWMGLGCRGMRSSIGSSSSWQPVSLPCSDSQSIAALRKRELAGIFPFPTLPVDRVVGGHAVAVAGYDDYHEIVNAAPGSKPTIGALRIKNSWSDAWGDGGMVGCPTSTFCKAWPWTGGRFSRRPGLRLASSAVRCRPSP